MAEQAKTTTTNASTFEVLEEDDEFEEFQVKDWNSKSETPTAQVAAQFTDDWDDTELDDDFIAKLKAELNK